MVLSTKARKVVPSMLLRKLTSYSRKNRLYQAFRELGCVIRTIFLLQYISDAKLREIIQQTINKMEQFNAFSKWLSFGNDGKINALTAEESEKHIKYVDLLANAVILDNTFSTEQSPQRVDRGRLEYYPRRSGHAESLHDASCQTFWQLCHGSRNASRAD